MTEQLRRAFFEDLAVTEQQTAEAVREAMTSENVPIWVESAEAVTVLRGVLSRPAQVEAMATLAVELVHIALHSALVAIDGGSASAEVGNLYLVGADGRSIGEALHEDYVDHLLETGQLVGDKPT
jgi:hypothetical protein